MAARPRNINNETMTYDELLERQQTAAMIAREHGWLDDFTENQRLATILCEIGELIQADKVGGSTEGQGSIPWECADIVIASMNFLTAKGYGIITDGGYTHGHNYIAKKADTMDIPELALCIGKLVSAPQSYELTVARSVSHVIGAVAAWCEGNGIDLLAAIDAKNTFNAGREWRHGGRKY